MPATAQNQSRLKSGRRPRKGVVKERRRRIALDLGVGLLLTLALLLVKLFFETTTPGKLLDGMLYCWIQTRLSVDEQKLPVAVVDISKLDSDARPGRLTPRAQLERLIDAIIKQDPAAIGIDIDFSPLDEGWAARSGPQFFDYVRQLSVPVYLGVDRSRYGEAAEWLGAEDYQNLAGNIAIPTDDNREMPLWIRRGSSGSCFHLAADLLGFRSNSEAEEKNAAAGANASCLPAMNLALARKYPRRKQHTVHWPSSLLRPFHEELIDKSSEVFAGFFLPDYSVAKYLWEQTSTAVVSDNDVQLAVNASLTGLKGRIVLLGNTAWDKTLDKYPIPPWQKEVPGVYFHACAAYTLIKGPLVEVTEGARVGLDLLLATVILLGVSWLRLHYAARTKDGVAAHRVHFVFTSLALVVVLAFGYGFVQYTRVLWTDSLLVAAVLFFHTLLARHVENFANWVGARWHGMWFDERKEGRR